MRAYAANPSDAMTYQAVADEGVQVDFIGEQAIHAGSLTPSVCDTTEAGLRSAVLEQGYDVIDVPDPCYDWACWLAMEHPRPVVTVWENLVTNMILPQWRQVLDKAALVVARSPMTMQALKLIGVPEDKIRLIPAAVDTERFKPGVKDKGTVLYAGRLVWEKGLSDLLLASVGQPWRLIIAGDGPYRPMMEALIEHFKMDNVEVLGSVPHEHMPELYAKAEVFCYPSIPTEGWQEQFGISVLEAAASDCKIVLSHQSVFYWFATHQIEDLWMASPGDWVALRDRIQRVLQYKLHRERGTALKYEFSSEAVGTQIREAYGQLATG